MTYDLHIHSCLSPCGDEDMTPNNIAGLAMLNGVEIAALTDHNTTLNCPAFFEACKNYGVVPIPGMELTTAEEVHMVCLFPSLESAMSFGEYVSNNRMKIKNRPDIFGKQQILDGEDNVIGEVDELLISACNLDIDTAYREVISRGGVAYPAHVDKQSNGIIAILGDFPDYIGFTCAEFHDPSRIEEYTEKYAALKGLVHVNSSDSHYLDTMLVDPPDMPILPSNDPSKVRQRVIDYLKRLN